MKARIRIWFLIAVLILIYAILKPRTAGIDTPNDQREPIPYNPAMEAVFERLAKCEGWDNILKETPRTVS